MPDQQHWSSLRRHTAVSDYQSQLTQTRKLPHDSHDINRRLTLGDVGELVDEREQPARSVTLGDVGEWFKNKLPRHRPERGGTLRDSGYWETRDMDGMQLSQPQDEPGSRTPPSLSLPGRQLHVTNRQGRQSKTDGSDRLMDWNTPKNLGEALPDQRPSSKGKSRAYHKPLPIHRRWHDFGPLRIGKKHDQKNISGGSESMKGNSKEKGKEKQEMRRRTRAQSFAAVMHEPQGVLEVIEAKKKAKRKAREERESLRESGDYLGVQGINPQTGVLDVTSDSGESILSVKTEQKLKKLEARARHASSAAERKEAEIEIVKIHLDHDVKKLRDLERTEKGLAASATGKWRRGTHQWSSVQEPDLSPIAQSHRSTSALSSDAQPRTALLVTKDPQAVQEIQASSATSRDRTDQKPSHEPFLDKNLMEETEPGGTTCQPNNRKERPCDSKLPQDIPRKLHARFGDQPWEIHYPPDHVETNRGKFPRKRVPAYPRLEIPPSPDKTHIEPASDGKLRDTNEFGGTGTEQLKPVTNSSTSTAAPSWGQNRPSASERDRAVSDSRSPHRSPVFHGRNDNQAGITKPVQNNPRDPSQQRGIGRKIPGKRSASPASARDPSSRQQPESATERETRQHEQGRSQGGVCIHEHHHHHWLRSDNISIPSEKTVGKSRGYSAQAQAQPGDSQPKKLWHNSRQLGRLPEESWTEYIAEIDVLERDSSDRYYVGKLPGASEGTTTDGSIQRCRTIHRGASSTAPMQQFVNIHIHKGSRRGQDGRHKERNPTEGRGSFEQRSSSISDISYRAPKPNNPSGDARARQSSNMSERRRRHRRSFQ
ncbi:hypothetical protein FAVG1_03477 [Fusarium avenaceum]|nr:hypothetical protein FAVG1_03477 [Fusarium avenaceum]